MCFRFDACFGFGSSSHEDFGRAPSTPKGVHVAARPYGANHGVQGYHYGNGHKAASTYPTAAADEAGRKAYNDALRKVDHAAAAPATREGYGHPAYYAYAAADETLKLPARSNQVGDGTGYKARFYEPTDLKEDATDYHYYYPTTTTTTATIRY